MDDIVRQGFGSVRGKSTLYFYDIMAGFRTLPAFGLVAASTSHTDDMLALARLRAQTVMAATLAEINALVQSSPAMLFRGRIEAQGTYRRTYSTENSITGWAPTDITHYGEVVSRTPPEVRDRINAYHPRVLRDGRDVVEFRLAQPDGSYGWLRSEAVVVCGRLIQVEQVLMNLMLNARDAMMAMPANQRRLLVSAEVGEDVVVHVSDSGPGVMAPIIERLFEPFFTTKDVGVGTGLGLSLCRSMMEEFGGSITVRNAEEGAVFSLWFKRAEAMSPEAVAAQA